MGFLTRNFLLSQADSFGAEALRMGSLSDVRSEELLHQLDHLYADTTVLKIWKTARKLLEREVISLAKS